LIIVSVYTGLIFHPKINHSTFIDTVSYNFGDENWIDIDQIKSSTVIDESKKKELIRVLESATEDSNPILMIATLK